MGSYLGLCGAETRTLGECQVQLQTERDGRARDCTEGQGACERRCRAAAAHAASLARFGFMVPVMQQQGLPWLLGHLVHPDDVRSGRYDCNRGPQRCLRARAVGPDWRCSAVPVDLGNLKDGAPVALLVLDLAPAPRVHISVWGWEEAKAQGPLTRFLAPNPDGTLTTTANPCDWWLGQDAAHFAYLKSADPTEWFQLFTDADPTRASMLTLEADGGLRVVPLAEPIPSLPFLLQAALPPVPPRAPRPA